MNCGAFTSRNVMQLLTHPREMGVSEKYQVAKEYVRESPLFSVCVHTCAHTSVTAQLQCEIVHFSVV